MGIKNFHKWLSSEYPTCFTNKKLSIDNLYFDMNYMLHNSAYGATDNESLFARIKQYLEETTTKITPTKSITLATDGPAAYAKLLLQRKRRLRMTRDDDFDVNKLSPIYFTPGTNFMKEFGDKIETNCNDLETTFGITINKKCSGPDEAETKIFKQLIAMPKNDTHVIVSNDADVIVMAVANPYYNNIRVAIKSKTLQIFNVGQFVKMLSESVKTTPRHLNIDFAIISLMLGNDYIPKLGVTNFKKMWQAYLKTLSVMQTGLYDGKTINKNFMIKFLSNLVSKMAKQWVSKFRVEHYKSGLYENYIEGLSWCIGVYSQGYCTKYDYMYNYNVSPHPLGLLYYLELLVGEIPIPKDNLNYIPDDVYAVLVLPKKAMSLIDKKYHNTIKNKLEFLYAEETCDTCIKFYEKNNNMHKTIKFMEDMEEDNTAVKKQLFDLNVEFMKHRKTHKDITIKDIDYVIKCLH